MDFPPRPEPPLPVGISQCLLGERVRYDGSDAETELPRELLDGLFDYRGICPEVGIGMSVPRDPIRLIGTLDNPRAVGVESPGQDVTAELENFASTTLAGANSLAGYIFMEKSPSCGLFAVKVFPRAGGVVSNTPIRRGRGVYAAAIAQALPNLPIEENSRLRNSRLRENFVRRVFAYAHWRTLLQAGLTARRLKEFHARYQYLLMAQSPAHCQTAGRLLGNLKTDIGACAAQYLNTLMAGLRHPASRDGHANVLSHLRGYLKKRLNGSDRQELLRRIAAYRRGDLPLSDPLTLLESHLRGYSDKYVQCQIYLAAYGQARAQ